MKYSFNPLFTLAAVLWMVFIFILSHQPDLRSGLEQHYDFILRKIAHISVYFVLTVLWFGAQGRTRRRLRQAMIAAGITLLYAFSDEWHQSFVSGRQGSFIDVAIDTVGISAAVTALHFKKIPFV